MKTRGFCVTGGLLRETKKGLRLRCGLSLVLSKTRLSYIVVETTFI